MLPNKTYDFPFKNTIFPRNYQLTFKVTLIALIFDSEKIDHYILFGCTVSVYLKRKYILYIIIQTAGNCRIYPGNKCRIAFFILNIKIYISQ